MKEENRYLNKKLILDHIKAKKSQGYTNKKYNTFFDGRVLQICFCSTGCKYSENGSCIMCNYGKSRRYNLKEKDIRKIVQEVTNNLKQKPKVLLLNSLGSILDNREIPLDNLKTLLDEISKIDINVIIFETHYLSISIQILELIKHKLSNKEIVIELGLESSNKFIREKCLNKYIDNEKFIETIDLIKKYKFGVETNVIFGTPFLTITGQIKDTIDTIKWCFENNIDKVNIFPINIKPYTLLYKLYEEKQYKPIRHKDFIRMLKQIPKKYIDKIYLCWYGNRQLNYDRKETILPVCDENEYIQLMKFYKSFNLNRNKDVRLKLLNEIITLK